MGAKDSKYRDENVYEQSGQFTESQVGHLLEEQKKFYEQKMAKISTQQRQPPQTVVISSTAHVNLPPPGAPAYLSQPYGAASPSTQATLQTSAAPVASWQSFEAAHSSGQASLQTSNAPVYPRLQSVATSSPTQESPQAYGAPVYPSLPHANYAAPVLISSSSPSAPPLENASLDRARTPYSYTQHSLHQKTTLNIPAQPIPAPKSAVPPRAQVQSATENQPRPRTPNSDFVFVDNAAKTERPKPTTSQGRDRSASRSRPKKNQEDDEIKCPTCKRTYVLPIFCCPSGHSSCNDCKKNGRACGICYLNITTTKNFTLETYIAERKVQCPYSEEGCVLYIKVADIESHIKECPFREMTCPVDSIVGRCPWKGKLSEIEGHFDAFHPIQRQGNVDTEMYLNITSGNLSSMSTTHIARLIVFGTYNFMFHLRLSQAEQKIYATVGLLGTAFSASKWTYEIHIYNKSQPRRKYQHVDVCSSANIKLEEIFNESKCAAIPVSYASTFVNDNKLAFKFYIKKDCNEKGFKNNRGRGRGAHRK